SPNHPPSQPGSSGPSAGDAAGAAAPPDFAARPSLPDRHVTAESIEDAYVRFIFYCNPALSLSIETTSLREAFRNPPRSGGKSFNTFAIYELVRKFYDNEIRTWTELTTRLGVEPPDPSKEESAQKIAQYGVRLKKWMNSMHVKAFFEYLMDIPNDYWTKIPTDGSPTSQPVRDGVALEDDMALRALLPHIRPKRGRKRPVDDDTATSPAQRSHLAPSSAVDDMRPTINGPLSADPSRLGGAPWTPSDGVQQTPLFRWPQSAITPTTRNSFWDDALEPQSAVTPSKPRLATQRRGPKNVSSAWRPGVPNGGVKPRGRPPMNKTPIDTSLPPFPSVIPTSAPPEPITPVYSQPVSGTSVLSRAEPGLPLPQYSVPAPSITSHPLPHPLPHPQHHSQHQQQPQPHPTPPRPARPSISLQVPERPTGSVRLATPPPVVVINGEPSNHQPSAEYSQPTPNTPTNFAKAANQATVPIQQQAEEPMSRPKEIPRLYFERLEDRTNVDQVIGYMMRSCFEADWFDAEGNPSHKGSVKEALGIVNCTLEEMFKTAASPEAFLINLAAVTGGGHLLAATTRICRLGREGDTERFSCQWEYGFGHMRGHYQMEQAVPIDMLKEDVVPKGPDGPSTETAADGTMNQLSASEWQAKYAHLLEEMQKTDVRYLNLQTKVAGMFKGDARKE
ncbi:hypothetical protein FALBO_10656, partial [Fusarium albosuccineum]